jgi:transcriptional regulator with XRE-family HTH domain
LQPEEIKFLRKDLHLKAKELALTLGVTASTVSRWENGKKEIGEAHDRLFRSIYMMHASEMAHHIICEGTLELFKELPAKRKMIKQSTEISLNPQEWLSENLVTY